MVAETKYDNARRYYLKLFESDFEGREIPEILINRFRKKGWIECQTLVLVKLNQRIEGSHQEVVLMSDQTIQELIDNIRGHIPTLFRTCESIAVLDMITAFAHLATTADTQAEYTRPQIADAIAVESGRHPIKERVHFCTVKFLVWARTKLFNRSTRTSSLPTTSTQVSKSAFRSLLAAT